MLNEMRFSEKIMPKSLDAKETWHSSQRYGAVLTRRGKLELNAKISERPKKGIVFIPFHFSETPWNLLTNAALLIR